MSTYRLTVEVMEPNQDFDAQMEELAKRERERYGLAISEPLPSRLVTRTTLAVDLGPEQWQAVQRAVLEVFK